MLAIARVLVADDRAKFVDIVPKPVIMKGVLEDPTLACQRRNNVDPQSVFGNDLGEGY